MAPPRAEEADITYILEAFALLEEVKPDWTQLAAQKGISHRNNAYSKFRNILKKHGFSYENSRITRLAEDAEAGTETLNKAAPKKVKGKARPAPKKRTLQEKDGKGSIEDELNEAKEDEEGA